VGQPEDPADIETDTTIAMTDAVVVDVDTIGELILHKSYQMHESERERQMEIRSE
jgi:hypothetical protein